MTDIFISYSRKDVEMVSILARTLEESGYSVWWDVSGLHGGQSFAKVIQQKLNEAKCAIVVWSPDSVESNWVHSEATLADRRGILLTAVYREAHAPMPFNNRHNEDLRGWNGNVFEDGFQKLIKAVERLCPEPSGKPRQAQVEADEVATLNFTSAQSKTTPNSDSSGLVKKIGAGVATVAIVAAGYFLLPKALLTGQGGESQTLPEATARTTIAPAVTTAAATAATAPLKPTEDVVVPSPSIPTDSSANQISKDRAEQLSAIKKQQVAEAAKAKAEQAEKAEALKSKKQLEEAARKKKAAATTTKSLPASAKAALSAEKAKQAANSKIYNLPNNLTLLPIPAGEFMMGSDSGRDSEKPAHKVTFAKPFWMSKTEITFDQYDTYAKATGKSLPDDSSWGRGSHPVINVSWDEAQGYVKSLSVNNNRDLQCRLPSEAEWEYAARAGSTTKYSWGDSIDNNKANCDGCGSQWDGRQTAPAGSFSDNAWGLQDMHGNAWEWVQDPWHDNYQGAPNNGEVWEKGGDASRMLRGGSWFSTPNSLSSVFRFNSSPDYRNFRISFRVVCSPSSVIASEKSRQLAARKTRETEATRLAEEQRTAKAKLADEKAKKAANSKIYKLPNNLTLLPIPAGDFMMGSDSGQDNEKPVRKVTFTKPFWMSKTEITFDQYDTYSKATDKSLSSDNKWGRGSRPAINVSWDDVQGYVKWLSSNNNQGLQCRLPSEAEWEYAARAGSSFNYSWGDTVSHEQANYGKDGVFGGGLAKGRDEWINTSPVGSFPPNKWGLEDMHGNVWEWVEDPWHANYRGAPNSGEVWKSGGDVSFRVLRGGSWDDAPVGLRSAHRSPDLSQDGRDLNTGFRIVCSPLKTSLTATTSLPIAVTPTPVNVSCVERPLRTQRSISLPKTEEYFSRCYVDKCYSHTLSMSTFEEDDISTEYFVGVGWEVGLSVLVNSSDMPKYSKVLKIRGYGKDVNSAWIRNEDQLDRTARVWLEKLDICSAEIR